MKLIELIDKEMNDLAGRIRADIKPVSGKTAQSFKVVTTDNTSTLLGNKWIETGRKPGKMPPVKNLLLWVEEKFNPAGKKKNIQGLAYIIARNIGEHGTKLWQQGGRTDIFTDKIPPFIKDLKLKLNKEIITTVKEYINFKKDANSN
jgi:hypothetical protein